MKKLISFLVIIALSVGIVIGAHNIFDNDVDGHFTARNAKLPENLMLVNAWNEIDEDYEFETVTLTNGEIINELIYPDLQSMFNDARNSGIDPVVTSGYRTLDKQQQLYDDKVNAYIDEGYSRDEAEEKANEWVALPGYSEHHTGLAVDINAREGASEEVYKWLEKNCHKYGFILRYPADKTEITGINYEPWHFRYVGYEAAEYIYEHGITLEEYLENVYEQ
ncbi:MAG: M15 family metallopeptidase [Clostridia bacterium]|nr:M15 family metallopeptidase [Clostridia bacterium]